MFGTILWQLLVALTTSLVLASIYGWSATRRNTSGDQHGELTPLEKWLVARRNAVTSFIWGVSMYAAMIATPSLIDGLNGKDIHFDVLIIFIPICALCAVGFNFLNLFWLRSFERSSKVRSNTAPNS